MDGDRLGRALRHRATPVAALGNRVQSGNHARVLGERAPERVTVHAERRSHWAVLESRRIPGQTLSSKQSILSRSLQSEGCPASLSGTLSLLAIRRGRRH